MANIDDLSDLGEAQMIVALNKQNSLGTVSVNGSQVATASSSRATRCWLIRKFDCAAGSFEDLQHDRVTGGASG